MIFSPVQILLTILAVTLGTMLTRFLPFLLFPNSSKTPKFIRYLGKVLPYAVMAALVVYCLKDLREGLTPEAICMIPAVLVVTAVHLWKRNTVLSIFVGTVCYMVLIRVFA